MDVQFLYLDESGDGGWTPKYDGSSQSQYFIYAGVIVDGEQNHRFKQEFTELLNEYFSGWGVRQPEEIHYADIVHGNEKFRQLDAEERSDMRDDIFEIILDVQPELMGTVVDKNRMKERYGRKANPPKRYGFRSTIDRFHKHLIEHDCVGVVTMDMSDISFDRRLRELIFDAQATGIKLPGASSARDTTLPRLMDTVTISPSEMSIGIQIADVVAYQLHNYYNHGPPSHGYEALKPLFRSPDGHSFKEPSVIPK